MRRFAVSGPASQQSSQPRENTAATGSPAITGTAQAGETLTAGVTGISDSDGLNSATFSYQWLADDVEIYGATANSYTLTDTEAGKGEAVQGVVLDTPRAEGTDDAGASLLSLRGMGVSDRLLRRCGPEAGESDCLEVQHDLVTERDEVLGLVVSGGSATTCNLA